MEGSESSRSCKRDVEDSIDAMDSWKEDDEREDADGRKSQSSKVRKHGCADRVEDPDDARRGSSTNRYEPRRKSVSGSGQAYSDDEEDYNVRKNSRVSKVPRRSPEEKSEISSDVYKDRGGDSSRRRREDKNDSDSSRRSGSRTSSHDVSHSEGGSKAEGPYNHGRHEEKDVRHSEGIDGSREKQWHRDLEEKHYKRGLDDACTSERADEASSDQASGRPSSGQNNHKSAREAQDYRDGSGERDDKHRTAKREEKDEKLRHQAEYTYGSNDNLGTKGKLPYLDDGGNAREQSMNVKEKPRDDYISHRGMERNKESEESREYMRNHQREDSKGTNDYGTTTEWSHGPERLDGGSFQGRSAYRKDSRGRYESSKGLSSYGNRYDNSDSIEIRPNRNLDFGREGSVSGRRTSMAAHEDLTAGTNDPAEEDKRNYRSEEDSKERYYDDAQNRNQNTGKGSVDSPTARAGLKGPMTSDTPVAGQSGSSSLASPIDQQGSKGSKLYRGVRGRPNGRDPQRMGGPVPMMPPPPFGPLGLPPGPMQPMGPNMSHSPSPLGPGIFMPPFPGPLVWAGARGMDVNMLAVPPNLLMPPLAAGPGFSPSVGAGPNHNIQLDQTNTGRGGPTDAPVPGFNPVATPSHEMLHDKPPGGWTPQRNSGPARKAPSRGEQNDYSQNFVDTGLRPQNFIRELELTSVVEDYPKLRELIQRKDEIVSNSASAPMYYKCDLKEHVLSPDFLGTKFDVILVDPPWEEYVHRAPVNITAFLLLWVLAIADTPSFIFLWVGDGVGLEQGRQCLKKWGFRRCEDVCWVKTNKKNATPGLRHDSNTLFQRSKEHCLMGIKGTVRRSTDGHIIHANIDTDIIIAEEPSDGSTKKPEDMYRIIEHFALGRRRLELFGEDHNIRPGWLTLGKGLSTSNFNKEAYIKNFADRDGKVWQGGGGRNPPPDAPHLVVTTPEIESLRPKSPQKNQQSVPTIGSSSSTNRRPGANTSQNVVTVVGSETMMPAPWASTPMAGFGMLEGGAGPDSNDAFGTYGFSAPFGRSSADHMDFNTPRLL
ncbi:hypothetical protein SETIT_9G236100v2 [Setaria italica]|uniref:Methyltransferase-like protein 1 n=1 Tax=Setaria italica TaxID=4555 RepID=A0A368SJS2_SETIT|nr:hypothetical protein SETIT_9G236100v2 [Setaria italica]